MASKRRGVYSPKLARRRLKTRASRCSYADGLARGRSPSPQTRARVGEDIHLEESQLPAGQAARYRSLPAATRFSRPGLARASHFCALVSARCNPRRGSTLSRWRIVDYRPDYHFAEVSRIVVKPSAGDSLCRR